MSTPHEGTIYYDVSMINVPTVFGHHQVELERGKLRHQLSRSEAGVLV